MVVAPYAADICTGSFSIADHALRRAFSSVNTETLGLYGLRAFDADGKDMDVGLFDERREAFEAMCQRYASGEAELADFQTLCEPGCGLVANSLQSPHAPGSGFNELADDFIRQLGFRPNEFPETIDIVMFMGSYDRGFGMHRDTMDVTAFVLDGSKHIVVRDGDVDREWHVRKGEYLRWRSVHWHRNMNPDRDWAMTINFSVGPDELRCIPKGTPVEFAYPAVQLRDFMAATLAEHAGKLDR